MSRSNAVFKDTYNRALDYLTDVGAGVGLPPETEFAERWTISRTTVRAVLERLHGSGLIEWDGRRKTVLRLPEGADYFDGEETLTAAQRVEARFMEFILGGDLAPGSVLRESELARAFGTSPSAVREFLIGFSRFGLIEKEPNRHWVLRGFTRSFAVELFDVREMFEKRGFEALLAAGSGSAAWRDLVAMGPEFQQVIAGIEDGYLLFPRLDERFHAIIVDLLGNRFVDEFFQAVSMIFHYHYRWNKADEMERNRTACREHLAIVDALASGDSEMALTHFRGHLTSARRTLLASVLWEDGV